MRNSICVQKNELRETDVGTTAILVKYSHFAMSTLCQKFAYSLFSIFFLFINTPLLLNAQDIHFSQYYNSPLNINPALSGVYREDSRLQLNARDQWRNVPASYTTFSGAWDKKFGNYKSIGKKIGGYWAAGLLLNYDLDGTSLLSHTRVALNTTYILQLAQQHFISIGFQIGGAQRAFQYGKLNFDAQFDGFAYDPKLATQENFGPMPSIFYWDLAAGINYHYQMKDQRTKIDMGVGLFQLNRPNTSFYETGASKDIRIPNRMTLFVQGAAKMTDRVDIVAHVLGNFEGDSGFYNELVAGAGLKLYLSEPKKGLPIALTVGSNYRLSDAIIPFVELQMRAWHVGLSYDITLSKFDEANNKKAGPELSLRYSFSKVKLDNSKGGGHKVCPIF